MCATTILAVSVTLALSPDAYLPMLARAFMLEWAFVFVVVACWSMWKRSWWIAMSATAGVVMTAAQVQVPHSLPVNSDGAATLRVAHMNVFQPNDDHAEVLCRALATNADILSVQEVSPEWATALSAGLRMEHPYQYVVPRENCTGIALFSKLPFERVRTITIAGTPFIEAVVLVNSEPVRVFAVHATSPGSYAYFRRRNTQLDSLADAVHSDPLPTLVIGDLNTVHWDGAYQRFCARSGAQPITTPFTITWPSVGPLTLIPLDHVLVAGGLRSSACSSFAISDSDHRGLLAELHIAHAR